VVREGVHARLLGDLILDANTFSNVQAAATVYASAATITGNSIDGIRDVVSPNVDPYGIFLIACPYYELSDNSFEGSQSSNKATYGAVFENTGIGSGIAFVNELLETDFGVQTQGRNPNLKIRCNDFVEYATVSGRYAWTNLLIDGAGELRDQGKVQCNFDHRHGAGNRWLDLCQSAATEGDIYVEDEVQFDFDYWHHLEDANGGELVIPECATTSWSSSHLLACAEEEDEESCEDPGFGLTGDPDENCRSYFEEGRELSNLYKRQIDSLEFLEASSPLSPGAREALIKNIVQLKYDQQIVEGELMVLLRGGCDTLDLATQVDSLHSVGAKMEGVRLRLSDGNIEAAGDKMDLVTKGKFLTDSLEVVMFKRLMDIYIELIDNEETIFDIDSIQEEDLREIAESGTSQAVHAESLLYEVFEDSFSHPIMKISEQQGKRDTDSVGLTTPGVQLYPNPSSGTFSVVYELNQEGTIRFFDLQGTRVAEIGLKAGAGGISINVDLAPGLYLYRLMEGQIPVNSGKLVIVN
jgi:hypothetical protein